MKETRAKLRELNDETALFATAHLIDALKARYSDLPMVQRFLDEVREFYDIERLYRDVQRVPFASSASAVVPGDDG